ncbi:MAG: TolC family outer membrane protein [Alphaproteobacteria bacterium]|nr:TolC family outer membrane protein [Alphaproteobacteria bacterium]
MTIRAALAALSVLAFLSTPTHAETLEQAWAQAYQTNPGLAAKRSELKITQEQITMARTHWQPTINAVTGIGKLYDDTPNNALLPASDSLTPRNFGVEVVQPIFRGFRTIEETSAAQKQAKAQYARFQAAQQRLFLNVAAAYLDIVRDQAVVDLMRHNQEVLDQQLQETQKRLEIGEVTRTDVMQAQSREQGAKTALVQAQGQLADDRAAYLRFVGTEPSLLQSPDIKFDPPQSEEVFIDSAVTKNPAVIAASYSKDQADNETGVSKGNLLPELNLVGSATRSWEQSEFIPGRQDEERVMLQLKIPLYQAGADYSQIRSSEHKSVERRMELEDVRLAVKQEATSAWQALTTARSAAASDQAQVDAASQAWEGVCKEAKAGTRTTLDILNAEQELLVAKVALVQAKRDEALAIMQIKASTGALTADALCLPQSARE